MRKYFINIKDCINIRHYFIIVPTKHQICYVLNRDSFTLRKTWKWFESLKIKELLMNKGSQDHLHKTNHSPHFIQQEEGSEVHDFCSCSASFSQAWLWWDMKKKLATIGRSETLNWGRGNAICRVHSTGYCHKGI